MTGTNANMVVSDAARIGKNRRLDALITASTGDGFSVNLVIASSPTTIASSTTIPIVMMNPNSVIMLRVPPVT